MLAMPSRRLRRRKLGENNGMSSVPHRALLPHTHTPILLPKQHSIPVQRHIAARMQMHTGVFVHLHQAHRGQCHYQQLSG